MRATTPASLDRTIGACYQINMSPRLWALTAFAGVTLMSVIGLWVEVRATPAPVTAATVAETKPGRAVPPPVTPPDNDNRANRLHDRLGQHEPHIPRPPRPPTTPPPSMVPGPSLPEAAPDPVGKDARLDEATKLYDAGDYDGAGKLAQTLLATDPSNTRMLRIAVSSACMMGDNDTAQRFFGRLLGPDRDQMVSRCSRYGITFKGAAGPAARPPGMPGFGAPRSPIQ